MLERRCRVIQIDQGRALLRAEPGSCNGCIGCAGRCSLLPDGNAEISVSLTDVDGLLRVDDWASLVMHESTLRKEALRGYGLPLTGLLLGAVLGYLIAERMEWQVDFATAAGAFAGTLLALSVSQRGGKAVCRVRPDSANA